MYDLRRIVNTGVMTVIIVIGLMTVATADSYLKHVATTASFEVMGEVQPEATDTSITWVADGKVFTETNQGVTIARFDLGWIYMIDHNVQTYSEMPILAPDDISALMKEIGDDDDDFSQMLAELRETGTSERLDQALADFEANPEMARMFRDIFMVLANTPDPTKPIISANVNPTDEIFHYGPWRCRKYVVTMTMPMVEEMVSEIWATEEIDIDYNQFMQASMAMTANWPGFPEAMEEFKKIKGMAVHSDVIMRMMGFEMNVTSELIEYREEDSPEGIYEIPKGYTKVDPGMMQEAY